MSEDLIRRSDAIKAIDKALGKVFVEPVGKKIVDGIPTIEPKRGEWIPCSERLPSENGDYLISLDFEWGREVEMGAYIDGEWYNDNRHVNIAWMPLPEPYDSAEMREADDDSYYKHD